MITYLERPDEISKLKPTLTCHCRTIIILLLLVRHIVMAGARTPILTTFLRLPVDYARWSVALGCAKESNLVNGLFGDDHWEYLELSAHVLKLLLTHLHLAGLLRARRVA